MRAQEQDIEVNIDTRREREEVAKSWTRLKMDIEEPGKLKMELFVFHLHDDAFLLVFRFPILLRTSITGFETSTLSDNVYEDFIHVDLFPRRGFIIWNVSPGSRKICSDFSRNLPFCSEI